ncbi:MAG: LON peptidase substrate-binding domain-containing protein [Acidimicrobiia bacterium]|nr:LON peptidase substrate-binding domain-containing protein [Acidimicrobiia bacterium]
MRRAAAGGATSRRSAGTVFGGITMAIETLPMFPLGLVAFPGSVVPLRLFEARYLALHEYLVMENDEFGIVLIERGSAEAGGSDDRFDIGCVMSAARSAVLDDGTVMVIAVGTERIKVHEWLEPDPYPLARVERLPSPEPTSQLDLLVPESKRMMGTILDIAKDMGADVTDVDLTLPEDPVMAMYGLAHMAPLQEMDQQRILESDDAGEAAELLRSELASVIEVMEFERNNR